MKRRYISIASLALIALAQLSVAAPKATLVTSTEKSPWVTQPIVAQAAASNAAIIISPAKTQQTITGFGTCFNEQGWASLNVLPTKDREAILKELFAPGVGASFNICRMPVGANDFALNWYSYNETDGDFDMKDFSIDNDKKTLIPFIQGAKKYNAGLKIWASPWSPPQWMKKNKHFAQMAYQHAYEFYEMQNPGKKIAEGETGALVFGDLKMLVSSKYDNGLKPGPGNEGKEGTDMFIQDEKYLKAYALYFSKFIDAYKSQGIDIFGVMPQNEFNSAQVFPSCCWTAKGLSNFVGKYLGPAMKQKGVEILFGTMERPNAALVDTILSFESGKYVTGVGFQWAGKDALPTIHQKYPNLKLIQSEQECGNGDNDWKNTVHSWELMKHYFNNGVSAYDYWNTSLFKGGISRWGWPQNSLVVVDSVAKTFAYTPEYYLLKHVSHFVKPGAKKLETAGTDNDVIAFINPDKSIVVALSNQDDSDKQINITIGNQSYFPVLKANSFSTLFIK
jgi:O-Glycosyl hydrolase